jgi:hypothetical protein
MSKKNRESQDKGRPAAAPSGGSRWMDYFWANLIFFAFLGILAAVVRASCDAPGDDQNPAVKIVLDATFQFIVALFGGGFLLVTLFDAAYEFFSNKTQEDAPAEGAPKA